MTSNGDATLAAIREKVEAGQRLSFDDGLFLDEHADLFTLGELANSSASARTATSPTTTSTRISTRPTSASTAAPSAPSGPT